MNYVNNQCIATCISIVLLCLLFVVDDITSRMFKLTISIFLCRSNISVIYVSLSSLCLGYYIWFRNKALFTYQSIVHSINPEPYTLRNSFCLVFVIRMWLWVIDGKGLKPKYYRNLIACSAKNNSKNRCLKF